MKISRDVWYKLMACAFVVVAVVCVVLALVLTHTRGEDGADGVDGVTITNIETEIDGNVSTYTIKYSDGDSYSFSINNGQDGVSVQSIEKTSTDGNVDTYTIYYSDGTDSTFTIANGTNGKDGVTITDVETETNGNVSTYTVKYSDGGGYSFSITDGQDGVSVQSVDKTSTDGNIDTYTIYYSDGTFSTFIITNGTNGTDGVTITDVETETNGNVTTYTVRYSDGGSYSFSVTDGQDGVGVESVDKTSTDENVDTYTIYYSDGTYSTFTVTNGTDGKDGADGTGIADIFVNDGNIYFVSTDAAQNTAGTAANSSGVDTDYAYEFSLYCTHAWVASTSLNNIAATCTSAGANYYECSICGAIKTEAVEATGHSYSYILDSDDYGHTYYCTACHELITEQHSCCKEGATGVACDCGYEYSAGLTFTINDDGQSYTLTGYDGTVSDVVIPAIYNGYPVIAIKAPVIDIDEIKEEGFLSYDTYDIQGNKTADGTCSKITSVYIPSTITEIDAYTFYSCENLTSVTLCGVTSIGEGAFYWCEKLTSVTLNEGLITIGEAAFSNCSALTSVVLPASLQTIGDSAFYYCSSLTTIDLPSGLKYIGDYAFAYDSAVTSSVVIPDGVTHIGESAFKNCLKMKSITLPAGITEIPDNMFSNCQSITEIDLGGVTSIGISAFFCCYSLTSIDIPYGVTSIPTNAFSGCVSLKSVSIPQSVTSIGNFAFEKCTSLTSIVIPSGVTSIGMWAFYYCYSLAEVYNLSSITITAGSSTESYEVGGTSEGYAGYYAFYVHTSVYDESKLFDYGDFSFICDTSGDYYLIKYNGTDRYVTLPDLKVSGLSTNYKISDGAFYHDTIAYNAFIISIVIPDTVTSIGRYAFNCCTSLTTVTIGSGVTEIWDYAFYGCKSLTSVTFANTSGWKYLRSYSGGTPSGGTDIDGTTFSNATSAAEYLTSNASKYLYYTPQQ